MEIVLPEYSVPPDHDLSILMMHKPVHHISLYHELELVFSPVFSAPSLFMESIISIFCHCPSLERILLLDNDYTVSWLSELLLAQN